MGQDDDPAGFYHGPVSKSFFPEGDWLRRHPAVFVRLPFPRPSPVFEVQGRLRGLKPPAEINGPQELPESV